MKIYISNLGNQITDESLRATFATYGVVGSATVMTDENTGYSRGFAFVEMPDDKEAVSAIQRIDGSIMNGRMIQVEKAVVVKDMTRSYPTGRNFRRY